jgi:hypothetical protein
MKPDELDAMLERMLAEKEEYIPDDGFTGRVLCSLPPPRLNPAVRMTILALCATAGLAVTAFLTPAGKTVLQGVVVTAQSIVALSPPPLWSIAVVSILLLGAFGATRLERDPG